MPSAGPRVFRLGLAQHSGAAVPTYKRSAFPELQSKKLAHLLEPKQGPTVSNTTSHQRPPAGHRAIRMPKAHPVAIATQAPLLRNATQREKAQRRARAWQRVTPKQVGTPNVQPPRSNSGAARSTNRAPPADRAEQSTRSGKPSEGKAAETLPRPAAAPADGQGPASRQGIAVARPTSRRPIWPEGEHTDIPLGRRSTSQRQPLPLTLTPPRQATPRVQRTERPRRPVAEKHGATPPRSNVNKSTVSPPVTAKPPGCQPARRPGPPEPRDKEPTTSERISKSKGEATGSLGSAPTYKADTPVGHLLRRANKCAPVWTQRTTAPPTISRSNKAPWQGPPTLIAAASVAVEQDKWLQGHQVKK
ncbi:hypothetical protein WOLCODRAFT_150677 [Wolfiporia cocos MD-104 SS10]|uniref:Uncharacterized protein n=1 Tax=Wolfiporia cocos (strain MD-104) TaxID=742152 RepID=A0A2H3JEF5_WOLCO|nr:hypothetical protein WOLCODRAFT_150677 [Wolfiporia cocos MD-104 SS10]